MSDVSLGAIRACSRRRGRDAKATCIRALMKYTDRALRFPYRAAALRDNGHPGQRTANLRGSAMRVLVVEDDAQLRGVIVATLADLGHSVQSAADGVEADLAIATAEYDLIVLDLNLPRLDGIEVLRRFRARRRPTPVLILTARDSVRDRIRGLDAGADDYLVKPFDLGELEARARALLRRSAAADAVLREGGVEVDTRTRSVRVNGSDVALTPREFAILEALLLQQGRVVGKARLGEQAAAESPLLPGAIDVFVHRLRRKLEHSGLEIKTIRGVGYLISRGSDARS